MWRFQAFDIARAIESCHHARRKLNKMLKSQVELESTYDIGARDGTHQRLEPGELGAQTLYVAQGQLGFADEEVFERGAVHEGEVEDEHARDAGLAHVDGEGVEAECLEAGAWEEFADPAPEFLGAEVVHGACAHGEVAEGGERRGCGGGDSVGWVALAVVRA